MTRQTTAKEILGVDWDFVVPPKQQPREGKGTHAVVSGALPREEALKLIAKDDPRPMLVFRECINCQGTEEALFSRRLDNEKTQLLLNWFHCVKMPTAVSDPLHPFHNLFIREKPHYFPHLFVCRADGSGQISFKGDQPQSEFQDALVSLIETSYEKNPKPAIQSMLRLLSQFDMLDLREQTMRKAMYDERIANGKDTDKHRKYERELEEIAAKKEKVMQSAKAVCDLKIKVVAKGE